MTLTEAKKYAAQLGIKENIYLLIAYALEEKYPDFRKLADYYLERAQSLCHQQNIIWHTVRREDIQ